MKSPRWWKTRSSGPPLFRPLRVERLEDRHLLSTCVPIIDTQLAANSGLSGIAFAADDRIWVTEFTSDKIGVLSPEGTLIAEYDIPTPDSGPFFITPGPDGDMWFVERNANQIGSISGDGSIREFSYPNSQPAGIVGAPDGNLWFTAFELDQVVKISPDGLVLAQIQLRTNSGPFGIATAADGTVWFTEVNGNRIGRIDGENRLTEFSVPTPNSGPWGIVAAPDGDLWFTENNANQIGQLSGREFSEYPLRTPDSRPYGIAATLDSRIWFTENTGNKLGLIEPDSNRVREIALPTPNSGPRWIAANLSNSVVLAEFNADRVGKTAYDIISLDCPINPQPLYLCRTGLLIGQFTVVAQFTDTDVDFTAVATATLDWGDTTSAKAIVFNHGDGTYDAQAPFDHIYPGAGTYVLTVTFTDNDSRNDPGDATATASSTADLGMSCDGGFAFSGPGDFPSPPPGPRSRGPGVSGPGLAAEHLSLSHIAATLGVDRRDGDQADPATLPRNSAPRTEDFVLFWQWLDLYYRGDGPDLVSDKPSSVFLSAEDLAPTFIRDRNGEARLDWTNDLE